MPKNYYWDENKSAYRASIDRNGKTHTIGVFKDEIDAQIAVAFWKASYHQDLANKYHDQYEALTKTKAEAEEIEREREEILDSLDEYERDDL